MGLSGNRCDSIDSLGSITSSSADAASHGDETVQMQQFAEKLLARINRMKKQLMDKTSATASPLLQSCYLSCYWLM